MGYLIIRIEDLRREDVVCYANCKAIGSTFVNGMNQYFYLTCGIDQNKFKVQNIGGFLVSGRFSHRHSAMFVFPSVFALVSAMRAQCAMCCSLHLSQGMFYCWKITVIWKSLMERFEIYCALMSRFKPGSNTYS